MLLHSVRFLCSVAAAFARLVRHLRKALAMAVSARSPVFSVRHTAASPIGLIAASPLLLRRNKAAPVTIQEQLMAAPLPAPAMFVPAQCDVVVGSSAGVEEQPAETYQKKKKAAWATKKRPSMLVIPVANDADEVAAGWGAAAASEKDADVEVEEGFCVASKAGPRHAMEDGYAVITDKNGGDSGLAFYGVYDGHGGRAAVDFVSEHLGKNVVSAVLAATAAAEEEGSAKEDAVSAAIRAAYLKTDSELLTEQQGASGGACAATALVKGESLYVAHLGDCRAVLSRSGGAAATALTCDHTCASEAERARVEREGGYVSRSGSGVWRVQGSLAVSRAFGDAGLKRWVVAEPAVGRVPLASDAEFLVVASDGLWDKVGNQEAVDKVRGSASRAAACRELVDMARLRGGRDDVTVMVVDLQRFLR